MAVLETPSLSKRRMSFSLTGLVDAAHHGPGVDAVWGQVVIREVGAVALDTGLRLTLTGQPALDTHLAICKHSTVCRHRSTCGDRQKGSRRLGSRVNGSPARSRVL